MVLIKIAAILIFCLGAARAVNTANWHPFAPNGFAGIVSGASIVFFTYIGFDAVSTAAEECKHPQRDLPFGIIATLIICTTLYGSVSLVLTGIANWKTLDPDSAGRGGAQESWLQPAPPDRQRWRAYRHDLVAAGGAIRTGANLVRDVARQAASRCLRRGASRHFARRTSAPGSRDCWWGSPPVCGISIPSRS